ncbi:sialidase family protein [Nocardia sp. NPDC005366]|uniref:sialidase family protein n=1 Tax=Nocardia sp. NPDC005366 TaxID=3156878 RepID=UPI0033A30692
MRAAAIVLSCSIVLLTAGAIHAEADPGNPDCSADAGQVPQSGAGDPRQGPSLCEYPTGEKDTSPSIAVSKKTGAVFISRKAGGIIRSTDGGATWQDVAVPPLPNGDDHNSGLHAFVQVDPITDRLFYVTNTGVRSCGGPLPAVSLLSPGAVISWSDDAGHSWQGNTITCKTWDWGQMTTGPAPAGSSYPSVLYFMGVGDRPLGGRRLVFRSLDGGQTFEEMHQPASVLIEAGMPVTAPDGTIYFEYPYLPLDPSSLTSTVYPFQTENLCKIMVAVSEDYAETWRQVPVPGSNGCQQGAGGQQTAVDSAGTVYVSWVEDQTDKIMLSHSRDKARTWSTPMDVTPAGARSSNNFAGIAAGAPGRIVISTMTSNLPPQFRFGYLTPLNQEWYTKVTYSENATADEPRFTTLDFDPPGSPSISPSEISNETNAYLAMPTDREAWMVVSRHSASPDSPGDLVGGRLRLPDTAPR